MVGSIDGSMLGCSVNTDMSQTSPAFCWEVEAGKVEPPGRSVMRAGRGRSPALCASASDFTGQGDASAEGIAADTAAAMHSAERCQEILVR